VTFHQALTSLVGSVRSPMAVQPTSQGKEGPPRIILDAKRPRKRSLCGRLYRPKRASRPIIRTARGLPAGLGGWPKHAHGGRAGQGANGLFSSRSGSRTIPAQPTKPVEPSSSVHCGFNSHLARQGKVSYARDAPRAHLHTSNPARQMKIQRPEHVLQ
jgi:hypothetical protein